jgi:copper(I)-binding protein
MHQPRLIGAAAAACLVVAGFVSSLTSHAQSQTIQITNAWARRAAMGHGGMSPGSMDKGSMDKMQGGATGAVYLTITNTGKEADALVSASSDAARTVELHEVKHEGGVMKMRPVQKIDVPAGGKIEMKPGGYHVMLMGLTHDLKPGEEVPLTLKFERGGEIRADAAVR